MLIQKVVLFRTVQYNER